MYSHLIVTENKGIAQVELHRPEVFNALNLTLLEEIKQAFLALAENEAVRVVVLTGCNDAFCTGADLKEAAQSPAMDVEKRLNEQYIPMIMAIRNCPKPVIAKINGVAVGAGMSLALACDMTIARDDTYFAQLFVQIGLAPDAGSLFFLPRMIGMQKTFELCATGRKVMAQEAEKLGLVNQIVPANQLDIVVETLAQQLAQLPTASIAATKRTLMKSFQLSLPEVMQAEAHEQAILGKTQDFKEGVTAFLEKRKPNFIGK